MRLRCAADGHYYIIGPIFGGGPIATFQISSIGLDLLMRCGVADGHQVPQDLFSRLHREKHIWTGGGGVGDPTGGLLLDDIENLTADLKYWSRSGNPDQLRILLSEHHPKVSIAFLFPESFCRWVVHQELAIAPDSLKNLPFYDVYENLLSKYSIEGSYLHQALLQEVEGCNVLYFFMKWIAEVYAVKSQQGSCPGVWTGTIHATIFNILDVHFGEVPTSTTIWKRSLPFMRCNVHERVVELVLPEQVSPPKAQISLVINNTLVSIPSRRIGENAVWLEMRHRINAPESPVKWHCDYRWENRSYGHSSSEFPRHGILLWEPDGTYIDPFGTIHADIKNASVYLLVHNSALETVASNIELNHRDQLLEPEGWDDWLAYRLTIPQTLEELGPYRFPLLAPTVYISVPEAPCKSVQFVHSIPTFLGKWPTIEVHSLEKTVQILVSSDERRFETIITDPAPVKLLDLNSYPETSYLFGTTRLKAICNSISGNDFSSRDLVRLPDWQFGLSESSPPSPAKELCISNVESGTTIVGLDHCTVKNENEHTFSVTASDPLERPNISLGWERPGKKPIRFGIRLPVQRGAIVEKGESLPKWHGLPLRVETAQFLASKGEVRIELDEPVSVQEDGVCSVKASVGPQHRAGHLIGSSVKIPFARLREVSQSAPEALFIRTKARWECFLEVSAPPGPPTVETERSEVTDVLWNSQVDELRDLWERCSKSFSTRHSTKGDWNHLFFGSHIGDWKRTGELLRKIDIPEATYLRLRCTLRCHFWDLEAEELHRDIASLPLSSYKMFTEGEYWYRFARSRSIEAPGALDSAYERLATLALPDPTTALEAYCIAAFIAVLRNKGLPTPLLEESPVSQFFAAVFRYFIRPVPKGFSEMLPAIPNCLPVLLVPEDVSFLQLCKAQIERNLSRSRELVDSLSDCRTMFPVLYDLLCARQYRLEGQQDKSSVIYKGLVSKRDFILDEMFSL